MEKTWAPPTWKTPAAFPTFPQLRRRDRLTELPVRILGAGHYRDAALRKRKGEPLNNRSSSAGNLKRRRASAARASCALNLAWAGVGEGPEDSAGVPVHDLTEVHGNSEQEDQEEEVDAKE